MKVLVVQILGYCIEGTFNYEKVDTNYQFLITFLSLQVIKIAKDNADGISDLKVRLIIVFAPFSHLFLGIDSSCTFYYF